MCLTETGDCKKNRSGKEEIARVAKLIRSSGRSGEPSSDVWIVTQDGLDLIICGVCCERKDEAFFEVSSPPLNIFRYIFNRIRMIQEKESVNSKIKKKSQELRVKPAALKHLFDR